MGARAAKPKVAISPNIGKLSSQRCFLEFKMGGHDPQRVNIYLYNKIVPKTTENFKALCSGELPFGYKVINYIFNIMLITY